MNTISTSRHRHPLALGIALALAANFANAATITVTDGGDSGDSGTCTLRQAIAVIAASDATGTICSNSGDGFGTNDTIVFDNSAGSTITLGGTQLEVTSLAAPLTIQGSGQTIDAQQGSRVLYVNGSSLTASSLNLTGGYLSSAPNQAGGGVKIFGGALTLTDSSISGNSDNSSSVGGGGINAGFSTVVLTRCSISDNYAFFGGGGLQVSSSSLTLSDSTVSGNYIHQGAGSGLDAPGSPVTMTNSTIYGNASPGGPAIFLGGSYYVTSTMTNSTVTGNSAGFKVGGVYVTNAHLNLYNTILANNIGGDCYLGSFSASEYARYSLIKDSSNSCSISNGSNGNIVGSDPMLGPLQENGGPTRTLMPAPGSPAIEAGGGLGTFCPATDQRGVSRPQGTYCDIGAVERQSIEDYIFNNGFDPD